MQATSSEIAHAEDYRTRHEIEDDGLYCDECGQPVDSKFDLWDGLCEDCRPVEEDGDVRAEIAGMA